MRCCLRVCLFVVLIFAVPPPAAATEASAGRATETTAATRAAEREAIRQTPILQRPSRPGHFYGNTVRRIHRRRISGR